MSSSSLATLLALVAAAAPALATIAPSSPISSTVCKGGAACKIAWLDNSASPPASAFGQTSIGLYVGNQYQQTLLQDFGDVDPSKTSSISPTIDAASGADSDGYFIRFQSLSAKDSDGNPLQSFSSKFTLSGMSGSFSDAIKSQMAGVTSGPAGQVLTATGGAAATAEVVATVTVSASKSNNTSSSHDDSAAAPSARGFSGAVAVLVATVLALTLA